MVLQIYCIYILHSCLAVLTACWFILILVTLLTSIFQWHSFVAIGDRYTSNHLVGWDMGTVEIRVENFAVRWGPLSG